MDFRIIGSVGVELRLWFTASTIRRDNNDIYMGGFNVHVYTYAIIGRYDNG